MKKALNEGWRPEENGFEFSSTQLDTCMRRRELIQKANEFDLSGEIPPGATQAASRI